ncbi:hypothetical protein [Psychrobacter sp. 72-O-c]|uniref:hypothetical protein n=1 Tax=Psychrobacter sp. 72-O-c TaxID=2774125 RepID=UPI001D115662|nr:hypothetical protein [Psychrobacter sp. 72-O-c]
MIRYQGVRRIALLARPLISISSPRDDTRTMTNTSLFDASSLSNFKPLDWHADTLPLLTQQLQDLPKVRIELHLPKSITL